MLSRTPSLQQCGSQSAGRFAQMFRWTTSEPLVFVVGKKWKVQDDWNLKWQNIYAKFLQQPPVLGCIWEMLEKEQCVCATKSINQALHHPDHVNKDAGPCGDVHALHHPFHTWYWQSSQKFLVGGSCMFILCVPTWLAWGLFAGIMDLYTGVSTGSITHSAIHVPIDKSYCLKCASLDGVAHRWSRLIQVIPIFWSHLAPYSWAAANLVCSQVLSSNFVSFAPPSSASLAASANRWGWRCLGRWQRILACVFFGFALLVTEKAAQFKASRILTSCVLICTALQNFQLFFHYVV